MSVNKCQENDEGRKPPFPTISTTRFRPDLAMDAKTTGGNFVGKQAESEFIFSRINHKGENGNIPVERSSSHLP